eukprot:260732-Pelagomonas_calceolata.AAC.3
MGTRVQGKVNRRLVIHRRFKELHPGARKAISGSVGTAAGYLVLRGLCKHRALASRKTNTGSTLAIATK